MGRRGGGGFSSIESAFAKVEFAFHVLPRDVATRREAGSIIEGDGRALCERVSS